MRFFYYIMFRSWVFVLGRVPTFMRSVVCRSAAFFIFDVLRFRRSVVLKNLRICFPSYSKRQRLSLAKRYYVFVCVSILENFYLYRLNARQAKEQIEFENLELLQQYLAAGQSVVQWAGHINNIEFSPVLFLFFPFSTAYKSLRNKYIDRYIKSRRESFGAELVPSHLFKAYCSELSSREPRVYQFIADQRAHPKRAFMLEFFGVSCPFFKGAELIAKRNKMPMVYLRSKRLGFARYSYEFVLLDADASTFGARTQQAVKLLEEDIKNAPESYYWLHRRFKYVSADDIIKCDGVTS